MNCKGKLKWNQLFDKKIGKENHEQKILIDPPAPDPPLPPPPTPKKKGLAK